MHTNITTALHDHLMPARTAHLALPQPDGWAEPSLLTMPVSEAMQTIRQMVRDSRDVYPPRPQITRQADALTLALAALMAVRMGGVSLPEQGEHRHVCGVEGCRNAYTCHGARCAGDTWLCPACELDQRDSHNA